MESLDIFSDVVSHADSKIDMDELANSLLERWRDITVERFASFFVNEVKEQIEYARLCAGYSTCRDTSLLFNPHRLSTNAKNKISIFEATKNENFCLGIARLIKWRVDAGADDKLSHYFEYNTVNAQYIYEFSPLAARRLAIDYGLNSNSQVLDPCAGWGGRMIGFSTVVNNYTCCEPSSLTYEGLLNLNKFIKSFRPEFNAQVYKLPFEDSNFQDSFYDFALTSPPYFDTEEYSSEDTNSLNRYETYEQWVEGFYIPMIDKTMRAIKPTGTFILNIGDRVYPLSKSLFDKLGDKYSIQKAKKYLVNNPGMRTGENGETFYEIKQLQ